VSFRWACVKSSLLMR